MDCTQQDTKGWKTAGQSKQRQIIIELTFRKGENSKILDDLG
jgi:hypothetical protein